MKTIAALLLGLTLGWHSRIWLLKQWPALPPRIRTEAENARRTACWGIWVALLLAVLLSGCNTSPGPLRGGTAVIGKAITEPFKSVAEKISDTAGKPLPPIVAPPTEGMSLAQPDNPATPAAQTYEQTREEVIEFSAPSRIITETGDTRTTVEIPQGSRHIIKETRKAGQSIGAAQVDTSRADAAWLASFKGVQALGALVFLGGIFCFAHPVGRRIIGGKDTAVVMALAGLVMIFGPALLQKWGNWFVVAIIVVAAHWFYSRSKYKEGRLDQLESRNQP